MPILGDSMKEPWTAAIQWLRRFLSLCVSMVCWRSKGFSWRISLFVFLGCCTLLVAPTSQCVGPQGPDHQLGPVLYFEQG